MHEASIAQSIVETVLREAEKQNAAEILSVEIEIGALTFLGADQIRFWVETGFRGSPAEHAEIRFQIIPGEMACPHCGHTGPLEAADDPAFHLRLPVFRCPACHAAEIEVTKGREAVIRRISLKKHESE